MAIHHFHLLVHCCFFIEILSDDSVISDYLFALKVETFKVRNLAVEPLASCMTAPRLRLRSGSRSGVLVCTIVTDSLQPL